MAQKILRTFLKGMAMSNFICPTCGFNNIDCGGDGYKTDREIELEKKLEIENKELRRLLKECRTAFEVYAKEDETCGLDENNKYAKHLLTRISTALNESEE